MMSIKQTIAPYVINHLWNNGPFLLPQWGGLPGYLVILKAYAVVIAIT